MALPLIFDEDMASITDWTDDDGGNGVSAQATFDSLSCMDLYAGGSGGYNVAKRKRTLTNERLAGLYMVEMKIYHNVLGTAANFDGFGFYWGAAASNGLYIGLASDNVQIGLNTIGDYAKHDASKAWQVWKVYVNRDSCQAVLDDVYKATTARFTDATANELLVQQVGFTTTTARSYIDYLKIHNLNYKTMPIIC